MCALPIRGRQPKTRLWMVLKIILAASILLGAFLARFPNFIRIQAYNVVRGFLKQKTIVQTRQMSSISGEHFVVKYYPEDKKDAELVLATAEKFYKPVAADFNYKGNPLIPIVVYPTRQSLNRSFGWEANESAMGVYWAGVIRVLSPQVWITAGDAQEYDKTFISSGPMAHELTHLVVDYKTGGNYTRWFTEGLAQYEEHKLTGFVFDDPDGSLDQPLYPLKDMDQGFDDLPNQALAYRESYATVCYLVDHYGTDKLNQILSNLAHGDDMDQAFKQAIGVNLTQFEQNWLAWLKQNMN